MGWGSKLLHIAEAAGGVGLEIGTAGAATPYALPLIAGGAAGLVQDFKGDSAQKAQQTATNQALNLQKSALTNQTALLSPYAGIGATGLGNLYSLVGGAPPQAGVVPSQTVPASQMGPGVRKVSQGTPTGITAVPRGSVPMVTLPNGQQVPASSLAALNQSSFNVRA